MIGKQIKDLAWSTFKKTGDINTFLEFIQIENMGKSEFGNIEENQIQNNTKNIEGIQYGNYQNKGNHPF